jgi:hypothetical protein
MRLSKIKLAGFKSFVDPTVILPSNLTGVVGRTVAENRTSSTPSGGDGELRSSPRRIDGGRHLQRLERAQTVGMATIELVSTIPMAPSAASSRTTLRYRSAARSRATAPRATT